MTILQTSIPRLIDTLGVCAALALGIVAVLVVAGAV